MGSNCLPAHLNERGVRLAIDSANYLLSLDEVCYISIAVAAPLYVSGVNGLQVTRAVQGTRKISRVQYMQRTWDLVGIYFVWISK